MEPALVLNNASVVRNVAEFKIYECVGRKLATCVRNLIGACKLSQLEAVSLADS
jgi:hypothetical protein